MRGELILGGSEVELTMIHVAAAFESAAGFAVIGHKPVETSSQKGLKAGLGGVVTGKMILLESVCEESLGQIFCVLVVCLPFEANVFVSWFPITSEDSVEGAATYGLIIAASAGDGGVVGDRKPVKWSTNVGVWIHKPHEAIPYNLRPDRLRRFFAYWPIYGSVSSASDAHAGWPEDALSQPPHFYSNVRIAARRNRELLQISFAIVAVYVANHRVAVDYDCDGGVYDRILLRTKAS